MTQEPLDRPAGTEPEPVTTTGEPATTVPLQDAADAPDVAAVDAPPSISVDTDGATRAADDALPDASAEASAPGEDRHPDIGPHDSAAVVSVADVSRKFGDRVVVKDMNLDVMAGTILGIVGPSGSGKTTTIRMVTGALAPTSGSVRVLGQQPTRFSRATRERIGYMPQLFTLYPDLTARENVDFVASLLGLLWPRRRRRTKEVLTLLQLWDARNRRASNMSGGMQRRLELACALVHQPDLLILDEPTAGIDPLLRVTIWEELHRLRNEGRTLLVTTQYVTEAEECDQVALISGGRLIAYAPPEDLRREATGGDIIDVETAGVVDAATFESMPGVIGVRQLEPRKVRVAVEDAATGLPGVVEAFGTAGADVVSAQEQRISFDEVFAELIARDRAENGGDIDGEETAA